MHATALCSCCIVDVVCSCVRGTPTSCGLSSGTAPLLGSDQHFSACQRASETLGAFTALIQLSLLGKQLAASEQLLRMQLPQPSAGFGSPVGSPGVISMAQTPDHDFDNQSRRLGFATMHQVDNLSPLMFKRTPGVQNSPNVESGKRFSDWVVSTSPFTGQKTPPTVSMKSAVDGAADENTPPAVSIGPLDGNGPSQQHFQAWLKATSSAKWTPKASPATAALTPAQAPSPATTPMSICQLPGSAASPATAEPRSRPIFDLHDSSSSDEEDGDETYTTVGLQQVAAGAARMRAALAASGMATQPQVSSSAVPCISAHAAAAETEPLPPAGDGSGTSCAQTLCERQTQPQQYAADDLDRKLGQLEVFCTLAGGASHGSKVAAGDCSGTGQGCNQQQDQHQTPGHAYKPRMTGHGSSHHAEQQQPASPMQEVIGLMLQGSGITASAQGTPSSHRHSHHEQHHRQVHFKELQQRQHLQPPASPEQQLIQLMMNRDLVSDAFAGLGSFSAQEVTSPVVAAGQPAIVDQNTADKLHTTGTQAAAFVDRSVGSASTDQCAGYTSCQDDSDKCDSASYYSSDSGDEIDVSQLQELCGDAAAAGTPLSDIIGMLLTPTLKGTPKFSPTTAAAGNDDHHPGEEVGPRILFADEN